RRHTRFSRDWSSDVCSSDLFLNLKKYLPQIKQAVSGDLPFGIGLRLSNIASEELEQGNNFETFKKWLASNNCYVFTMNGFPYGRSEERRVGKECSSRWWSVC